MAKNSEYVGVYQLRGDGDYDLMVVVSRRFLEEDNGDIWLDHYAESLEGSRVIYGDDLNDFTDVLDGDNNEHD